MRTSVAIAVVMLAAGPARADWVAMSGAEITAALNDTRLVYAGAWQVFRADGFTLFNDGRASWGRWRVERDAYCSRWPPADGWAC